MATNSTAGDGRSFLAAPVDPFTYRTFAYLALAGPIGLAYTVVLGVGVGVTLGLAITPLGPLAAVATLLTVLSLAWADAHLTGGLLGVDLAPRFPDTDQRLVDFLKELALGRATWTSAAFLLWRAVLGLVAFVVLVTGISTTVALLLAPFAYGDTLAVTYQFGTVPIDTFAESLVLAAVGVLSGLGTLYATNLLGRASAGVADALLGDGVSEDE